LRDVLRYVPLDRMMLETDAPFLAPEGKRGKRNEPAYLVDLAREVARIKESDFDTVCAQTTQNAKKFFGIT
jgi:TatD DNase family protein